MTSKIPAFYRSARWRRLRYDVLKERGRRCEACGRTPAFGLDGIVINVDHIKPRRKYPRLAYEKSNLQVLCNECNHGKGNRDETDWRATSWEEIRREYEDEIDDLLAAHLARG